VALSPEPRAMRGRRLGRWHRRLAGSSHRAGPLSATVRLQGLPRPRQAAMGRPGGRRPPGGPHGQPIAGSGPRATVPWRGAQDQVWSRQRESVS